ncbi:MAG: exodeoxyribonuclease VII large subunit [Planctomycetota bacterium]|jgi:exodeoxyribonuclease VII large subunit
MGTEPHIFTVSEITSGIKDLLAARYGKVIVRGEVSGFRRAASNHLYFQLKDSEAVLSCAMWRSSAARMKFEMEDGLAVLAYGRIDVYPPRGNYQLIVSRLEPEGLGALQLAFEQLKAKLEKEGLFAEERKKPLPFLPKRIGIVTSETGAAIRDMLRAFERRFPDVSVVLAPSRVQGEGAAGEIAAGIAALNRVPGIEVIIAGRGGGSLEDLWPFNEETVARAIAASKIPVVSAVGHEIDFTISDFVADLRAATPTAAAEHAVPDAKILLNELEKTAGRFALALKNKFQRARMALDNLATSPGLRRPLDGIRRLEQELDENARRLPRLFALRLDRFSEKMKAMSGRLDALSPLAVLGRGYSITKLVSSPKNLRSAQEVNPGDKIETTLSNGKIISRVDATRGRDSGRDGNEKEN